MIYKNCQGSTTSNSTRSDEANMSEAGNAHQFAPMTANQPLVTERANERVSEAPRR